MKKKFVRILPLTLLILAPFLTSQESVDDIAAGSRIKLFSKVLNEERELFISLPAGYGASKLRYPVLFVADGSENTLIASGGMIQYFSPNTSSSTTAATAVTPP